jgi:hypothetical protein
MLRHSTQRRTRWALAGIGAVVAVVASSVSAWALASGSPNQTWGTNGRVEAMVTVGSVTYIGGTFTELVDTSGTSHPAANLAAVTTATGVADLAWSGTTNGEVMSLAASGDTLYVGGSFTQVDGQSHKDLAAIDVAAGTLLTGFGATTNKPVGGIAPDGGSVYIGGQFTSVTGGGTFARTYLAKLDATTGAVDTTWTPTPDARVYSVTTSSDGTTVYVGGSFTTINGISNQSTAALSSSGSGAPIAGYKGATTNGSDYAPVYDLIDVGSTLYLAVAGSGGACTAFSATSGKRIWTKHTNGNVQAVVYNNGYVYCGGHFGGSGAFDGQTRYKIGAVSATSPYPTSSFAPRFNSALGIWSLSADSTHLVTGGDFTQVNQAEHDHLAIFDDSP